ncbi:MAG: VWA domain-containing protein, partial [Bryobacteraceae bacterium]
SNLPLTIGLIVDMTPSETNMLEEERSASRAFLNKMLRPDMDKAFLIQFGDEVELLQDVTSSREKLDEALNLLKRQESGGRSRGGRPGSPGGDPGGGGGANSTALSDAIFLASDEIMKKQVGRKALFILGDGDHIGSREEMAITAAEQADTLVYAIRIYDRSFGSRGGWGGGGIPGMGGPGWGGGPGMGGPGGGRGGRGGGPGGGGPGGGPGRSDGKEGLQRLARKTGGSYFEVSKKTSLDDIYAKIEEELRSQYSLGYTPTTDARSEYRKIKIDVRKKGMVVQGREGYYPATS